jgi:threonine/homoserine/homoserine lactone efflux protein
MDSSVGSTIGEILPLAIGVAISPIPIVAVILMLLSKRAGPNSLSFLVGWMAGLTIVGVVVLALGSGADTSDGSTAADTILWGKVAIGVILLFLALRNWRKRPKKGEEPAVPKWMDGIDDMKPGMALGLGIGLSAVNPKNLALTLAAAATITTAGLNTSEEYIVLAVFVLIAITTVALPVISYYGFRSKADEALPGVKDWLLDHNAAIMAVIFLVFGAKILGDGLGLFN